MMHAYAVMSVDTRAAGHPRVTSIGIFSEENPTSPLDHRNFTVATGDGETFEDAVLDLDRVMDGVGYGWVRFCLDNRSRRTLAEIKFRRHGA